MKFFILIICLGVTLFNLYKRSQNSIKANLNNIVYIGSILLLSFGLFIWKKYDSTRLGLALVFSLVITFISNFIAIGINNNSFNVFISKIYIAHRVPFSKVKKVEVNVKVSKIQIHIYAYGQEFLQEYNLNMKEAIIEYISKNSSIQIYEK